MRGVLNVAKPSGISSYDVIRRLKPLVSGTRIGHAGTLDPLAQGVLLILLGEATKVADLLQQQEKEYQAQVRLGVRTDSDDITGETIAEQLVPALAPGELEAVLREFEGEILQTPPAFSAVRVKGKRAYQLARRHEELQLTARRVTVKQITLLSSNLPVLEFRAVVSKGTYLRALARDIGERLGCGATVQGLTRLRVGRFRLEQAMALNGLDEQRLHEHLLPIDKALDFLPQAVVKPEAVVGLRNGKALAPEELMSDSGAFLPGARFVRVIDPAAKVLVISRAVAGQLKPVRGIYDELRRANPDR